MHSPAAVAWSIFTRTFRIDKTKNKWVKKEKKQENRAEQPKTINTMSTYIYNNGEKENMFSTEEILENPVVKVLLEQEKNLRQMLSKAQYFMDTVCVGPKTLKIFSTETEGLKVHGIAFTEGTHNGTFYHGDEIEKAYKTLEEKAITIDHSPSVREIVGKVTSVSYNAETKSLEFDGIVTDEEIAEKIKDGMVNSVSVELYIGSYKSYEGNEDVLAAVDLEFTTLSLVKDPACEFPNCNIEALENAESKDRKGEIMSEEEKTKVDEVKDESEATESEKEDLAAEVQETEAKTEVEQKSEKVEEVVVESETKVETEEDKTEEQTDSPNLEDEIATLKKELAEKEEQVKVALSKLEEIETAEVKKVVEELSKNIVEKELGIGKDIKEDERLEELSSKNKDELEIIWNAIKDIENKKEKKEFGKGVQTDNLFNVERRKTKLDTFDKIYKNLSK